MLAEPRLFRSFVGFTAAFLLTLCLGAPSARAAEPVEPSPEYRADVMTLITLTGTDSLSFRMGVQMIDLMLEQARTLRPELPASNFQVMREEIVEVLRMKLGDLMAAMALAYARHFTHDEVKGLLAFYRSPLGEKLVHEMPLLVQETTAIGQKWGEELVPEFTRRIEKRLSPDSVKE